MVGASRMTPTGGWSLRDTVAATLVGLGLAATPAAAAGLPDGWTLEINATIRLERDNWKKYDSGKRESTRKTVDLERTFRVFALRDQLILSQSDFTYLVTRGDKKVTKNAVAAGKGSFRCVEFRPLGDVEKICAMYRPEADGATLTVRRDAIAGPEKGGMEMVYRLSVAGQKCRVDRIDVRGEFIVVRHSIVGETRGYTQTGTLGTASCRLIKGRKTY